MKHEIRSGMVGGFGFSFSSLMLYLTYALCFYVGAKFVHEGRLTFKDVLRVRYTVIHN
jgi:ATP-binding cassette subfamily B (MDR/TAP) protein 1